MALLVIYRTKDFDKNLLPKIDALTHARSCRRSDVVRDIFYTRFNYSPIVRSPEQLAADRETEINIEQKREKLKRLVAVIDNQAKELIMAYWVNRRGTYQQAVESVLCDYFEGERKCKSR